MSFDSNVFYNQTLVCCQHFLYSFLKFHYYFVGPDASHCPRDVPVLAGSPQPGLRQDRQGQAAPQDLLTHLCHRRRGQLQQ